MGSNLVLVIVIAMAVAFDFTNGFHDTANAMPTSIRTGAPRRWRALRRWGGAHRRLHLEPHRLVLHDSVKLEPRADRRTDRGGVRLRGKLRGQRPWDRAEGCGTGHPGDLRVRWRRFPRYERRLPAHPQVGPRRGKARIPVRPDRV